jgi:hypothetical protein
MSLTKPEQETIILFNESEPTAHIYTYNSKLKRRLGQMSREFPAEIKLTGEDDNGAITYDIPKGLVMVRKPVSEEKREAARIRALENNLKPPGRDKSPRKVVID